MGPTARRAAAPALVERAGELERLDAALRAARSGAGVTVVIEGAAGIGKTSLLSVVRDRAVEHGLAVLHARGSRLEREFAMGVVRQCFEPVLRAHTDLDGLLSGAARVAERIVLDVPEDLGVPPVGALHGLYWLTANVAARGPLLLAVDDAHWADEASLRFLAYLARRVETLPVALVIGTRVEEEAATGPLAEIRGDPATDLVQPAPLAAAGVEAFLRTLTEPVETDFARACHDATGGNPFLLGELVRALRAEGVRFTAEGIPRVTAVTPPTVARTVRATLERLGTATARARARGGGA
jgi:predicted ATPase